MASVQLYKGLVNATEAIVTKFGKDVLTEDRFANILADMYPDRDNPAVFGIIRTLIKDGYCSDLLLCNKVSIQTFVSKSTLALNQKNGFDKNLVESILNSLAVGCGVTSLNDYEVQVPTTPASPSKQIAHNPMKPNHRPSPKSATKPKPTHQSGQNQSRKQSISKDDIPKGIALLILSFFGLFIGTFTYILYLDYSWWMLFTIILIMIIHCLTILPGFALKKYNNKSLFHVFSAVVVFVLFSYFAPLSFISDTIKENVYFYWGSMDMGKETSGIFFCMLPFILFASILDNGIDSKWLKSRITSIIQSIPKFGFIITFIVLSLFYGLFIYIPIWDKEKALVQLDKKIEWAEQHRKELRINRISETKDFGFLGINLDVDYDNFLAIVRNNPNIEIKQMYRQDKVYMSDFNISFDDNNFKPVVDYVVNSDAIWDNHKISLRTYFLNNKIVGIKADIDRYNYNLGVDSLISIYSGKYGEPELKVESNYKIRLDVDYRDSYRNINLKRPDLLYDFVSRYNWVYNNGGIEIEGDGKRITYISSKLIEKYKDYNAMETQKKFEKKKKEMDSIQRENHKYNEKMKEEKIKQEKNHKESIKQI